MGLHGPSDDPIVLVNDNRYYLHPRLGLLCSCRKPSIRRCRPGIWSSDRAPFFVREHVIVAAARAWRASFLLNE